MKIAVTLLVFILIKSSLSIGQDSSETRKDYYFQKEIYSNLMGFDIDTMLNPALYGTIAEWLYTNYRYGGRSEKGIDCSDLCSVLYEKAYHKAITGGSENVFHQCSPVDKKNLTEGDFVFFKIKKNRISHVGVYLCKNKFVHASVSGVKISDLDEDYYRKFYFKGGRMMETEGKEMKNNPDKD